MNTVAELERILQLEQDLLLSGDYDSLAALVARKERLITRFVESRPPLDAEAHRRLADHAARNEALLGSARRGLQAALSQLRQLSEGSEQTTYSRTGERRPLSRPESSVKQKI